MEWRNGPNLAMIKIKFSNSGHIKMISDKMTSENFTSTGLIIPSLEFGIICRPMEGWPREGGDCRDCLFTIAPGEGQGDARW